MDDHRYLMQSACLGGDAHALDTLLQDADASVTVLEDSQTLLRAACRAGNLDIVRVLIANGVDVDQSSAHLGPSGFSRQNLSAETPLVEASRSGHPDIVRVLLANGVDAGKCESKSVDPAVFYAARGGHLGVVTAFLEHNANVNCVNTDGYMLLYAAAAYHQHEVAVKLLQSHADVDKCIPGRWPPLIGATMNKSSRFALELLQYNVNANAVDAGDRSPLFYAAASGDCEVVTALLERGANVDQASFSEKTPLHEAAREDWHKTIAILLRNHTNANAASHDGETPLYAAPKHGSKTAVALLTNNADPNRCDASGNSPLMVTSRVGSLSAVQLLLDGGASIAAVNARGDTALAMAQTAGHSHIVKALRMEERRHDSETRTPTQERTKRQR